tara:strand:+ start:784 stop:1302 length:519 start_codon:yes stop_codon:yes gene_type:complete
MISFYSIKTKKLKKKQILDIIKLKEQHWKFGLKSQLSFFKKNFKSYDIHNLLYFSTTLIGYTALKKRTLYKGEEKKRYLLFDTLVIAKDFRNLKLSRIIMNFNNKIIINSKMQSILICENKLYKFYKKFLWSKINKESVALKDYETKKNFMGFNFKAKELEKKIKLTLFFNR